MSNIQQSNGFYYISTWRQPSNIKSVINRSLEYTWIVDHCPVLQADRWWECKTQTKENGKISKLSVREMSYDIHLTTNEFLELNDEFSGESILLFQLDHPVPPSLFYYRIGQDSRQSILQKNGVKFGVEFPTPNDMGIIWSTKRNDLEELEENENIRKLIVK